MRWMSEVVVPTVQVGACMALLTFVPALWSFKVIISCTIIAALLIGLVPTLDRKLGFRHPFTWGCNMLGMMFGTVAAIIGTVFLYNL